MKRLPLFIIFLAVMVVVPVWAQTNLPATNSVPPGNVVTLSGIDLSTVLLGLIPVLVPLLVALGKVFVPRLPSWLLPIAAPALGALINWLTSLATGSAASPVLALALGSAGVGLREIVDQLKQQATSAPAAPPSTPPPQPGVKTALLIGFAIVSFGIVGCTTSHQTTAYNTLNTLEAVTTTGVDYYDSLVIKGVVSTNAVPQVSSAYNDFQGAMLVALAAVQGNSNAVAPPSLAMQSTGVLNLVTNSIGGK